MELHYLDCAVVDATALPAEGSGFAWVPAAELPTLRFPEANGPILQELARDARRTE